MKPFLLLALFAFPLFANAPSLHAENDRTYDGTITVGDLERTYLVHVPASYSEQKPAALIFVFHGGGGEAKTSGKFTGFSELSDKEGFIVVYPQGVDKSWNDGRNSTKITAQREHVDDIGFVTALLDHLEHQYSIDPKRIYATGPSNGGFFSNRVGAELSDRFAAIAPVIGLMACPVAENFKPRQPVSVLAINGTEDPLVPYNGGDVKLMGMGGRGSGISALDTVKKWADHDGCKKDPVNTELPDTDPNDGTRVKISTWSGGKDNTEVVFYTIEGGGHTWPGGTQYLPQRVIGKVCRDFNATQVIWKFFVEHPKS